MLSWFFQWAFCRLVCTSSRWRRTGVASRQHRAQRTTSGLGTALIASFWMGWGLWDGSAEFCCGFLLACIVVRWGLTMTGCTSLASLRCKAEDFSWKIAVREAGTLFAFLLQGGARPSVQRVRTKQVLMRVLGRKKRKRLRRRRWRLDMSKDCFFQSCRAAMPAQRVGNRRRSRAALSGFVLVLRWRDARHSLGAQCCQPFLCWWDHIPSQARPGCVRAWLHRQIRLKTGHVIQDRSALLCKQVVGHRSHSLGYQRLVAEGSGRGESPAPQRGRNNSTEKAQACGGNIQQVAEEKFGRGESPALQRGRDNSTEKAQAYGGNIQQVAEENFGRGESPALQRGRDHRESKEQVCKGNVQQVAEQQFGRGEGPARRRGRDNRAERGG